MTILCACAQSLWTTGENPVDKPVSQSALRNAFPFEKDKSFSQGSGEVFVAALLDAIDVLTARIDAIEGNVLALLSVLDSPLSPTESIHRLRELREGM